MNEEKYIKLKQLLIDGKYNLFENDLSKLEFDELIEFSHCAYENYDNKKDFLENYYGIKLLGEITYLITTKKLITINLGKSELNKFRELIFRGLASATEKSFQLGYYNDAEKYALSIINFHEIDNDIYLSFLSTLAHCAHYQNDVIKELSYCQKMLDINSKDPRILVNYSYALMRNKKYTEAKIELEKCLKLGYKDFFVYNQLLNVCVYGDKDFNKAFSYIENIFEISNGGMDLNDRNKSIIFNNLLAVVGLSGDENLLTHIYDFKHKTISLDWYELAEIYEFMNQGIFELNNTNYIQAQKYFLQIEQKNREGKAIQLAQFLNKICIILKEYTTIKKLDDIKTLFKYIKTIEVEEFFKEYKEVIENYFYLLNAFILLLEDNVQIDELDIRKNKLQEFNRLNLTTSEFIHKSFQLIKLIENYINDSQNSILKDNIKNEYEIKLKKLIDLSFDIKNETSFLYSLNSKEDINLLLCNLTLKTIELMQKNEPTFVKEYKLKKTTQLLEADFRNIVYYNFGLSLDITISAEALSRVGRTDLQLESKKFGTKTFEFKIWGSNDYKNVVKQIYEYLTDFEDVGFIFMVNKNKKTIDDEYIENLKSNDMGYISNSFEKKEMNNYNILISKHKIHVKEKTIYHFIYNLY
ncbi:MAG: hypothetical protein A2513_10095 [Sulfurimonas sp. RIFOXYD12_FULL_33_39]|uniref:hypothetical protein n=1 Tax=unclassified Sulfurimonas TaxID=2623549 RepID=UPI0008AA854E|nr:MULTISPECIES: hypothetical protein [unclassified Sulfurimonas]OHE09663.1 MAG: hypothetical protein A2513_10095 [Sulfurimonas sp. RIFOXYD12_FULL_33_39]OHE13829.1 MAG: hypothetical protein A2530_09660 [Sulfurimonas sp. RIFOXYD2_FULL_34_21]